MTPAVNRRARKINRDTRNIICVIHNVMNARPTVKRIRARTARDYVIARITRQRVCKTGPNNIFKIDQRIG